MSARLRPWTALLLLAAALAAPAAAPDPPVSQAAPAVLDALFPEGRDTLPLAALAARATLPPGEGFRVVELARDAASSHHLVAIRDRETPHRHDRHDLVVVVLEGFGSMQLGAEERPVGRGSILYVPRGSVHAFRNLAGEPAVAYAIYLPAFDGTDRVEVAAE